MLTKLQLPALLTSLSMKSFQDDHDAKKSRIRKDLDFLMAPRRGKSVTGTQSVFPVTVQLHYKIGI